jgi:hypothetical protein
MISANNYDSIVRHASERFKCLPIELVMIDGVSPSARNTMAEINSKTKKHRLIGVLFCNPNSSFCEKEVLPFLNYFHHRSEKYIDFYCSGYGAFWQPNDYVDQQVVTSVAGTEWMYSDIALIDVVKEFETNTTWQYTGENELLILDISPSNSDKLTINNAIVCKLEQMKDVKAFTSLRNFAEDLIRYAGSSENTSAWKYSDRQGGKLIQNFLKDAVLSLLPKAVAVLFRKGEHVTIKNITSR